MARRKAEPEIDDLPPSAEEIASDIEYQNYISEIGGAGNSVAIYRFPKVGKDLEWCDTIAVEQAPLEVLREGYGPGKYRLTFRRPDGSYMGHRTICIAAPYSPNGNGNVARRQEDDEHVKFMREQMAKQETMMLTLIAGMRGPDIGALMQGFAAMAGAANSRQPDLPAMLTALAAWRPQEQVNSLEHLKGMTEIIKNLRSEGDGKDDDGISVSSIVKGAVSGLLGAPPAVTVAQPAGVPPGARPVLPAAALAGGTVARLQPSAAVAVAEAPKTRAQLVQEQLTFLKDKARKGRDVNFWTSYIFENEDDDVGCAALTQALESGATFEHLLQFDAEIAGDPLLKDWFKQLYDGIRKGLLDTAGSGGDAGDTGSHEAISADGKPPAGSGSTGSQSW